MVKGKVAKVLSPAKIGELAFILVVIIAVVAGLLTTKLNITQMAWVGAVLMILGVIVSLTTITEAEVGQFLVMSVALIVASIGIFTVLDAVGIPVLGQAVATSGQTIGLTVRGIVMNIMAFVAPAAIIPSLKAVYKLSRTK